MVECVAVMEIFTEEEAEKICSMFISSGKLICSGMSIGNFSMKSAYHLGKEMLT
jgi:hypothetical protein